jgi:ferredoxin-NADP reductase
MPVTSNIHIKFTVLDRQDLGADCMVVYFRRPIGFEYEAGDWVDFGNSALQGGTIYSLSSSPTEGDLAIMFRTGLSPFKQHLQSIQPGDELAVTMYGNVYGFHLRENRNSVLIAGGIGIAPFRSMLKELVDTSGNNRVQLLYFNKGADFLLADELNEWAGAINLDLRYIDTSELQRKDRQKMLQNILDRDAHHYYIAGPGTMVESTEHMLIDLGIDPKDIRLDSFDGY